MLSHEWSHTAGMRSWFIGAVVFVSAAAVLVLEIIAGRILAPYVGVSLQTFTGIIGTVLAAIALGAWAGGRLADSNDPTKLLGPVLIGGGLLAVISPALVTVVGAGASGEDPGTIVILAFVGFFAPAAVLSMVTPIAGKLLINSLDSAGSVVGNLSAIGTSGALFGTFVTGFILIASVPSRPITWVVGAVLILFGAFAAFEKSRHLIIPGIVAAIGVFIVSGAIAAPCDYETAYSCVRIATDPERETARVLVLDTFVNSYVDLDDPGYLSLRYALVTDAVVQTVAPVGPLDIAFVGGGGYTLPRMYQATRGGTSTVLELDPTLEDISVDHLGLEPGPWLTTRVGDARLTIRDLDDGSFDIVVGDAFSGRSVPWHLTTVEFLTDVRDKLNDSGFYVMNTIDHPPTRFARGELATITEVFPHVAVVAPQAYLDLERGGNFILVGSLQPIDADSIEALVPDGEIVLVGNAARAWFGDAKPLTDDFAPVDQLISRP
ncbi:MAG: fused MFS/spermidine synthase [Actinomycetia bacterium]|nr:fused MFS/spermidine synthase [Actinomycetes bacterium]